MTAPLAITEAIATSLASGDELRRSGDLEGALAKYAAAADLTEVPDATVCVRIARVHADRGAIDDARRWALLTVDGGTDFASWDAAAQLLAPRSARPTGRSAPRASRCSAATPPRTSPGSCGWSRPRRGIALDVYEAGYGVFRQELLDPGSGLYTFAPDIVVVALDACAAGLPEFSDTPDDAVAAEVAHWRALWSRLGTSGASVVQHNFVVPAQDALAHLDAELAGTRYRMLHDLNTRLADALPANGHIVDCERLAARFGKDRWADPLWWDRAKLAVSLPATPLLARDTAAVIAGHLGLGRKCLVLDLDNTVWGGVIGEDGVGGLKFGGDATGDAFLAFQDRVLALKRRGVILAACSKNDEHVAREPFERHPEMRLQIDDFAAFVANWRSKVDNIEQIAADLSIGLDALAYVDDNPVERQEVRRFLPDVDVVALPEQPSLYARALADYPWFETGSFTAEDAQRTEQYRARARDQRARTRRPIRSTTSTATCAWWPRSAPSTTPTCHASRN